MPTEVGGEMSPSNVISFFVVAVAEARHDARHAAWISSGHRGKALLLRSLRDEFVNAQWVFHVPTPETMDRHFTGALLQEAKDSTRERACIVDMFRPIALEDNMPDVM